MTTLDDRDRYRCHQCPARLYDDNSMALHMGRHQRVNRGNYESDWPILRRQARRTMIEDLQEILDATR